MTIAPPGDIILEVARAADPQKVKLAIGRLAKAAGGDPPGSTDFAAAIRDVRARVSPFGAAGLGALDRRFDGLATHRLSAPPGQNLKALRSLEAFLLQGMIDAMLPASSGGHFGKGAAGNVWRSFFAETLGTQLASRGDLGIATSIAGRIAASTGVVKLG
jgi:hypothetical protein